MSNSQQLIPGGARLRAAIEDYISGLGQFIVFAPYMQCAALERLFSAANPSHCVAIVTTWKPCDVAIGVSDIGVYPFCRKRDVQVLLSPRLHMKGYVDVNFCTFLLTTANVSARGIGYAEDHNREAGTIIDRLDAVAQQFLDEIMQESRLVTDSIYECVVGQASALPKTVVYRNSFEIPHTATEDVAFPYVSFPMSDDPSVLLRSLSEPESLSAQERRSARHDLRLYGVRARRAGDTFEAQLRLGFFQSPPIVALLAFNGSGRRFGELAQWIHNHIVDVPAPRRYDVKQALQRVYSFVIGLGDGQYASKHIGAHTETLVKCDSSEA